MSSLDESGWFQYSDSPLEECTQGRKEGAGRSESLVAEIPIKTIVLVKSNSQGEPEDCDFRFMKSKIA